MQIYEAIKMSLDEEVDWDEFVFILGKDIGKYDGPYTSPKAYTNMWTKTNVRHCHNKSGFWWSGSRSSHRWFMTSL